MNRQFFRRTAALALLFLAGAASVLAQGTATTTSLSASPNPLTALQTVTITATIKAGGSPISEGTVTFSADSNTVSGGSFVAVANGTAQCHTTLAVGQHTLQAHFNGSSHYATSTSSNYVETVNQIPTTTTGANATAAYSGNTQNVSLTASVSGVASGGYVNFYVTSNGMQYGAPAQGPLANSTATATYMMGAGMPPGVYTIQAVYTGNPPNDAGSSDATHTLTITGPAPAANNAQGAQIIGCSYVVFNGTGYSGGAINGAFTDADGNPWPGTGTNQLTFSTTCQGGFWNAPVTIPAGLNASGLTLTVSQTLPGATLGASAAFTGITVQTTQGAQVSGFANVNGHPTVTMNGCSGEMYQLQRTTSLTAPSWVTVAFAMPTSCGAMQLVDPDGTSRPTAFYRVLVQ